MVVQFNESEIKNNIKAIFRPGTEIEVTFDIDSQSPHVYPTRIYKYNHDSEHMLVFQTHPKVLPSLKYDTMDLTVLLEEGLTGKIRVGLRCRIVKFINDYKISDSVRENFLLVRYSPPMRMVNLRSTFRLRTNNRFRVDGKIIIEDKTFISDKDFTVRDISNINIGLLVPKKTGSKDNPLLNIKVGESLNTELVLREATSAEEPIKVSTCFEIVRKVMNFNVKSGFIGARFINTKPEVQEKLHRFIHNAQLIEIRNQKKLELF